jgi:GNAT superfamily N-acetyltransferase
VSQLAVERILGADITQVIDDLARLRIVVFREYPYLYDGTLDYERRYLASYAQCPESVVVVARDAGKVVGASTAMPLTAHGEGLVPTFAAAGIAPDSVYYFGESVLDAAYRGRGLGHAFFDHREATARDLGYAIAAFCAVVRPSDHPRRPAGYVPHDAFWSRRGYTKRPELRASFSWRDVDESRASPKAMVFWLKELAS